jgi:hypothetical protein
MPIFARRRLRLSFFALSIAACSAGSAPPSGSGSGGSGAIIGTGGSGATAATSSSGGTGNVIATGGTGAVIDPIGDAGDTAAEGGACAIASADAQLVKEPVDIIVVLDNSGSMEDELVAVESNINVNFGNILTESGIDYRLILLSRHRIEDRAASESASTSICVSTPLSGLATCPAEQPVFSERFFQYSTKVESTDSFDVFLDTYEMPVDDSGREEKYDQAPLGWSAWLRPNVKKVILEMTDDNEDMPVATFVSQLTSVAPEHFGSADAPTFTFHSIIGVVEKATATDPYLPEEEIVTAICEGGGNIVENPGPVYQELSKLTGGLRFPLCEFAGFDAVFRRIAEDVVVKADIACDFAIPSPPEGTMLDLTKVAVNHVKGDGSGEVRFGQAPTLETCEPNAFYIADNRIWLCPDACTTIQNDAFSSVDVLFTCESTIILR